MKSIKELLNIEDSEDALMLVLPIIFSLCVILATTVLILTK